MNTQVNKVTGYSPCEMVYHCEQYLQIMFKIKSNDGSKYHRKGDL